MLCKCSGNVLIGYSCHNVKAFKSTTVFGNLRAGCRSEQFRLVTSEIIGKEEFTNTDAYHSQCLGRFTAVKRATTTRI